MDDAIKGAALSLRNRCNELLVAADSLVAAIEVHQTKEDLLPSVDRWLDAFDQVEPASGRLAHYLWEKFPVE